MKLQQIRGKVKNVTTLKDVLCPLKSMFKDRRASRGWSYLPCGGLSCSSLSSCSAVSVPWMASHPGLNTE